MSFRSQRRWVNSILAGLLAFAIGVVYLLLHVEPFKEPQEKVCRSHGQRIDCILLESKT